MSHLAAVWEPSINDRIRFVLQYDKCVRPIVWFEVKRDGSIYFGIRRLNPQVMKRDSKLIECSTVRFNSSEGEIIDDIRIRNNPKVSYHASGEVHLAGTVFSGMSMNSIVDTELIAFMVFEHLRNVFPVTKRKKYDIAVPFKLDEDRPLVGQLYVLPSVTGSPPDIASLKSKLIVIPRATNQTNHFFEYKNLDGCHDFTLQQLLYTSVKGPWPPYSYIIVPQEISSAKAKEK